MCHNLNEWKSKIQTCDVSVSSQHLFSLNQRWKSQLPRALQAGLETLLVGFRVKRTIKESICFQLHFSLMCVVFYLRFIQSHKQEGNGTLRSLGRTDNEWSWVPTANQRGRAGMLIGPPVYFRERGSGMMKPCQFPFRRSCLVVVRKKKKLHSQLLYSLLREKPRKANTAK